MAVDLSTLNKTQLQAAQWGQGPLLVLAGPGSGKTQVLTFRIARILEQTSKEHFRILGLTFTNRAAKEMRERIQELIPNASDRLLLSTFHSFAGDVLRQHGHLVGLRPDFTVLSQEADRIGMLDQAISECGFTAADGYSGERLLPLITRLLDYAADEDTIPRLLKSLNSEDQKHVPQIYRKYRRLMIERNSLDFGGLIAEALSLLQNRTAVRRQLQRIYSYICVDEFQDTNYSQYQLLTLLVNPDTKNLFVVADDDQIIYQWNGASPERLSALRQQFKTAVVQLPENYRCPPEVIALANRLIVNNIDRSADKEALRANRTGGADDTVRAMPPFDSFEDEAAWVAQDIASRSVHERARCVVLARTRRLLEEVVEHLQANGVGAYLAMRKDEFVSAPMQWLHSILRLANARQDREQLRRVCKAFYTLEGIDLNPKDVASAASTQEGDYLRAFAYAALARREIESSTRQLLERSLPKLADRLDVKGFTRDAFGASSKSTPSVFAFYSPL